MLGMNLVRHESGTTCGPSATRCGEGRLVEAFLRWTREGAAVLGQVRIVRSDDGSFLIHHTSDAPDTDSLEIFHDPEEARRLAANDADGTYRPLKSAPNLRRGWLLRVGSAEEALLALNYLHPGALGLAAAFERGVIDATPLRETLERQTGMYRVAARIGNEEAEQVVADTCNPHHCLKIVLWTMRQDGSPPALLPAAKLVFERRDNRWLCPRIPLVCREACNILVANARRQVKRTQAAASSASQSAESSA